MDSKNVGHIGTLRKHIQKFLVSVAVASVIAVGAGVALHTPTIAGGETRTLTLYQVHTKENLTITYRKDGRYVPSALKKINYFMRDWRRGKVTEIDPKTIDLMWELHADLGSKAPIHIICGYRSKGTNNFLKRIGRNVAKHSQHTQGKAIDFYFPDVKTVKIRNSALYRKVGGVGYYRSSGGPSGFVHLDTGRVRHWGPPISNSQMASIMSEGRKTMGRRATRTDSIAVADNSSEKPSGNSVLSWFTGGKKKQPVPQPSPAPETVVAANTQPSTPDYTEINYEGFDDELSELANDAVAAGEKPKVAAPRPRSDNGISSADANSLGLIASEPVDAVEANPEEPIQLAKGYPVPRPRQKPIEIMMLAAANLNIIPASATPETNFNKQVKKAKLATIEPRMTIDELSEAAVEDELIESASIDVDTDGGQTVNRAAKSDFATELLAGKTDLVPLIRPQVGELVTASNSPLDNQLLENLVLDSVATLRRNGSPPSLDRPETSVLPSAQLLDGPAEDTQKVNRQGKGHMPRLTIKLSKLKP